MGPLSGVLSALEMARAAGDEMVLTAPCDMPIGAPRPIPGYLFARYLPGLLMKASLAARRMRSILVRD